MFLLDNKVGSTALVKGEKYLFFSGYDYLGLQNNKIFQKHLIDGIKKYGSIFPSSRISNTQLKLIGNFEKYLSTLTNTKYSLSYSSGFLAGTAVEKVFDSHQKFVFPKAHPAINKQKNNSSTTDFSNWIAEVVDKINNKEFKRKPVIIADAVNPLTLEIYNFDTLKNLKKEVVLIVDDSHGIGIINNGKGIVQALQNNLLVDLVLVYSLSKAFSINAGAVSCNNKEYCELFKSMPEYTASTPASPALMYSFIKCKSLYKKQLKLLQKNIAFVSKQLQNTRNATLNINLPILLLPEKLDEVFFRKKKIIISSFTYPTSIGKKINRAVISALHTQKDLLKLLACIKQ